jgi:predicted transcriptional regulator
MTTDTSVFTLEDLRRLQELMIELYEAGREDDAHVLERAHATVLQVLDPHLEDDDDDPEFAAAMEQAERDIAEGRTIPHDEVMRELRESLRTA